MLPDPTPMASPCVDESTRPTRRKVTERMAERRTKLLEHLENPVIVAEDVAALNSQANKIYLAFKPRNGWQDWLTSEIAVHMVRINRCTRIERRMREYAGYRAIEFWEDDQQVQVETLAAKLHRDPARTVAKLRLTPVGCDWLLARWTVLARTAAASWTDEQRNLAHALIGADPVIDPTAPGFALGQVAELTARRDLVLESDEVARTMVAADLTDDIPNLAKLRRYLRSLHQQMKYYIDQFYVEHPDRWDDPNRKPAFIAQACIDRDRERTSTWNFAEPEPAPHQTNPTEPATVEPPPCRNETKPTRQNPTVNETKPTPAGIEDARSETKPIDRIASAAIEGGWSEPADWNQPAPLIERPDQSNLDGATRSRLQLARRRAALAGI